MGPRSLLVPTGGSGNRVATETAWELAWWCGELTGRLCGAGRGVWVGRADWAVGAAGVKRRMLQGSMELPEAVAGAREQLSEAMAKCCLLPRGCQAGSLLPRGAGPAGEGQGQRGGAGLWGNVLLTRLSEISPVPGRGRAPCGSVCPRFAPAQTLNVGSGSCSQTKATTPIPPLLCVTGTVACHSVTCACCHSCC